MEVIIALDQGTSSTRALAFDLEGNCIALSQQSIIQHYPKDGWVEHCAEEIYQKTAKVLKEVLYKVALKKAHVICLGITNQRETTVVWDKITGKPIYRAIVWQDRRTQDYCKTLQDKAAVIQDKTGLKVDPYFSATKLKWVLDNCDGARKKAIQGQLAFGTIDSYLIWCLTDGKHHKTDVTNASRTMLFDINTFGWDKELLGLFDVPENIMPEVLSCNANFGEISFKQFGLSIPITGVIGDQQSASIGQQCFHTLDAKVTLGTGAFLMINTGHKKLASEHLLSTVAYKINNVHAYALEGSIFNAGMIMQWLKEKLELLTTVSESEALAGSLCDNGGVYLVPAYTGLGAPHWQADANAMLMGLQLDSTRAHIARAALESVAYQVKDLLQTLKLEKNISLSNVKVDGGMVKNRWLMQFLSDLCQLTILQPKALELTAQGAAMIAGLGSGCFRELKDYSQWHQVNWQCEPGQNLNLQYQRWQKAVECCKQF